MSFIDSIKIWYANIEASIDARNAACMQANRPILHAAISMSTSFVTHLQQSFIIMLLILIFLALLGLIITMTPELDEERDRYVVPAVKSFVNGVRDMGDMVSKWFRKLMGMPEGFNVNDADATIKADSDDSSSSYEDATTEDVVGIESVAGNRGDEYAANDVVDIEPTLGSWESTTTDNVDATTETDYVIDAANEADSDDDGNWDEVPAHGDGGEGKLTTDSVGLDKVVNSREDER